MKLEVKNLNFSYGKTKILNDINFFAEKNSIISVLGSNGAGKTTLLKCLSRIHKPETGSIRVNGKNVLKMKGKELARHIGYVPQTVSVSRMTVFDAVLVGRKPHIELNATKKDIEITAKIIDEMNLKELSLRYLNQLSGGEFQKVQIARALAQQTDILILDEPSNNLDIYNQHKTMEIINNIVQHKNVCAIITMHDINQAIKYSDKLLFLKDGEIFAFGDKSIITAELIKEVYKINTDIINHNGMPFVIPR